MSDQIKYDDMFVFLPKTMEIMKIAEGTGDNLLKEDIREGYVDYINYEIYDMRNDFAESDGGMILLEQLFREKYSCTEDCIADVIQFHYDGFVPYVLLDGRLSAGTGKIIRNILNLEKIGYSPDQLEVVCESGYYISRRINNMVLPLIGMIATENEVDQEELIRWLDAHGIARCF